MSYQSSAKELLKMPNNLQPHCAAIIQEMLKYCGFA